MNQVSREDLVELLRAALGDENARRSIDRTLAARGVADADAFDDSTALGVLGDLATRSDLVGVAAGLAQTRLELQIARRASLDARDQCQSPPEGPSRH
jgi:hypothetical protein